MSLLRAAGLVVYRLLPSSSTAEYLLMQASYGDRHWSPPKGHLDPGEDDMTAALRETREEAGLDEHHLQVLHDFKVELNYEAHGKSKTVIYYLAKLLEPWPSVVLSHEHTDFRWVGVDEACDLVGYEDVQKALRQCHTKIGEIHESK